ncbi:MAG: hypothetical protein A2826_02080 [Candidatus Doudnabacteria bacterium RIFCSPHIGHO2_01_FULL_43_23]|uniref:Flippase-like domain-containing protein n=1 Tax=Candidatus Doudnabacteria bacterium RIFCSPHIGHO2_01_FULL_43_23 TaxID=1817822 RepID=A0A1F5NUT2_9BACT|nr:MAG: hypothetical protein A2826_02080 [Candidatus Doudnabacteria bacterium RIFCSPHIGHO2_01_FULL_43_23]
MKKFNWQKITGFLVPVIIFYFLIRAVTANFAAISEFDFNFRYFNLILSIVFIFFNSLLAALILKYFFLHSGFYLRFTDMLRVYSFSQLAKYIPGGIWLYLIRFRYLSKNVSKESFVVVSSLENAVYVLSGFFLTSFISAQIFTTAKFQVVAAIIVITILVVLLMPKLFYFFINLALRALKKDGKNDFKKIGRGPLLITLLGSSLNWLLVGIGYFFFLSSFLPVGFTRLPWFIAVFAASVTAGYVFVIAPGGLGVREGIMVLLLESVFGLEIATVIAIATRLWSAISEALIAGLISVFSKNKLEK